MFVNPALELVDDRAVHTLYGGPEVVDLVTLDLCGLLPPAQFPAQEAADSPGTQGRGSCRNDVFNVHIVCFMSDLLGFFSAN